MGKYLVVISVYQNTHRNTVCQAAVYCTYRYWIWNGYEGCGGSNIFYYRKAGFPLFGQRQIENDGNIDWREKRNCSIDVLLAVMTSVYLLYTKKKNSIDRTVTVILYTFYFVPSWSRLKKTPVKALVVYLPKEREEDWKQIKIKESDRERQRKKRRSSRKIFHLYTSNHLHDVITIFPLFPDWMIVVQPSYL
jgi:hypothetical protein